MKKNRNQFSIRFPNSTDERIIEFLEKQSKQVDTISYLIEEEIKKNGIRDLQKFIPAVRELPKDLNVNEEKKEISNLDPKKDQKENPDMNIASCFED